MPIIALNKIPLRPLLWTSLVMICFFFAACAPRQSAVPSDQQTDILTQKLSNVQLSQPLSLDSAEIDSCKDESLRRDVVDGYFEMSPDSAAELWKSCQALYACSPETSKALKKWFAGGKTFRVGFADLRHWQIAGLGEKVGGLYASKSTSIYVDYALNTPWRACELVLHELVHRFDPDASSGDETLIAEYRAYWQQRAFMEEIYQKADDLDQSNPGHYFGSEFRKILPHATRESILQEIVSNYKLKPDLSVIAKVGLPKLPYESKFEIPKPVIKPTASPDLSTLPRP